MLPQVRPVQRRWLCAASVFDEPSVASHFIQQTYRFSPGPGISKHFAVHMRNTWNSHCTWKKQKRNLKRRYTGALEMRQNYITRR